VLQPLGDVEQSRCPTRHARSQPVVGSAHAPGAQVTPHAHEALQSMPWSHEPWPVHATVHGPPPHSTPSSHDPVPAHSTSQLSEPPQSTPLLQLLLPLHWTMQMNPNGQFTWLWHSFGLSQTIVHVV
jgi:hypothetical protein